MLAHKQASKPNDIKILDRRQKKHISTNESSNERNGKLNIKKVNADKIKKNLSFNVVRNTSAHKEYQETAQKFQQLQIIY